MKLYYYVVVSGLMVGGWLSSPFPSINPLASSNAEAEPAAVAVSTPSTTVTGVTCQQAAAVIAEHIVSLYPPPICLDADNDDYDRCILRAKNRAKACMMITLDGGNLRDPGCTVSQCDIMEGAVNTLLGAIDDCATIYLPGNQTGYKACVDAAYADMRDTLNNASSSGSCALWENAIGWFEDQCLPRLLADYSTCLANYCSSY